MTKAIWVKWVDSNQMSGWNSRNDAAGLRVFACWQVGFLISEDEDQIVLSSTKNDHLGDATNPYLALMAIPKISIQERGDLALPDA